LATKVSIVSCPDYDPSHVEHALRQSLDLIGGLEKFIKAGQRVMIKVNALMETPADSAITTHPALVSAMVKEVKKLGAFPLVGDTPGNATADINKTLTTTGIKQVTEEAGGEIINLLEAGSVEIASPSNNQRAKTLRVCKSALEVDAIINLPKLKTHNYTLFTGAIKNMFGCVPGFHKAHYHMLAYRPADFSEILVDVFQLLKPNLNIMDGVFGMEGNGPAGGQKRFLGILMASADGVALDAVASHLIGYKPLSIDTTRIAHKRTLGEAQLERIETVGIDLNKVKKNDWKHPPTLLLLSRFVPDWMHNLIKPFTRMIRVNPAINQKLCTKCQICVNGCPTKTIHYQAGKVEIDLKNCIMCFCCHELCPYRAIRLQPSWPLRLLGIGLDN
jgi:uncharacterized protein (DUF362 family)/Pyruvate/2-oxoacid:ferredoxin oxidoreductase delta subunit